MRVAVIMLVGSLMVVGCGGGSDKPSSASSSTTTPAGPTSTTAAAAETFDAFVARMSNGEAKPAPSVNGHRVFLTKDTVYVDDCATGKELTKAGAVYGPSARDAEGNFTPGRAFICPS